MDKLKNAGDAIKKKLSLQDYQTAEQYDNVPSSEQIAIPAHQLVDAPAEQSTDIPLQHHADRPSEQSASMSTKLHTNKPAKQQAVTSTYQHADKSTGQYDGTAAEQYVSMPVSLHASETVRQQNDMLAGKPDGKPVKKIKVTHYLSEEDNDCLTNMYIKRLQEKRKVDKSALISQAIQLLWKRENK